MGTTACVAQLVPPVDAEIACAVASDCPETYACVLARCVQANANQPPRVVINEIARSLDTIAIPLIVLDAQADRVELAAELSTDAAVFSPIDLQPSSVESAPDGLAATVTWSSAQTLGGAFRTGLRLRITPRDAALGSVAESEPFSFGNDPPEVSGFTLDQPRVSGLALLRLALSDSAGDTVRIARVELSLSGDFSDAVEIPLTEGSGSHFPGGALNGLGSQAAPQIAEHNVTWDSMALLEARVDRPAARLRLQVADVYGAVSAPITSEPFVLDNANSVPSVVLLAGPTGPTGATPTIDFELADGDGDACVLTVDYSLDGTSWFPAASASPTVALLPGEKQFVWQASQLGSGLFGNVSLRLRATDGRSQSELVVTPPFSVDTRTTILRPAVAFVSPGDGELEVPVGGDLIVAFSIDVVPASLDSRVKLIAPDLSSVPLQRIDTELANTFRFHPTAALAPLTEYELSVQPGIEPVSIGAEASTQAFSSQFTTGMAPDVTPPTPVSAVLVEHVADGRIELSWTNPVDTDFAGVLILRRVGAVVDATPAQGVAYSVGATLGSAEIIGVTLTGSLVDLEALTPPYDYAFLSFDTSNNYAASVRVPLVTGSSLSWCTDETGGFSLASPDSGLQQMQFAITSGEPAFAGVVFPSSADALGATTPLAQASPVTLGTKYFVRAIARNTNGAFVGREQVFWASRKNLALVGTPPDISPGGTGIFAFEADGWSGFEAEVDVDGDEASEAWTAMGVTIVGNSARAIIADAGPEYRFQVRPAELGCPVAPWTVSPPFSVGNILYASVDGAGDHSGTDPTNAIAGLSTALAAATAGTDIRVAEGTYDETVELVPAVRLLGGYRADFLVRNPSLYVSKIAPSTKGVGGWLIAVSAAFPAIGPSSTLDGFLVEPALTDPLAAINVAIEILAEASPTISHNTIHAGTAIDNTYAIAKLNNAGSPHIIDNVIDAGSAQFNRRGVALSLGGNTEIRGNVITSSDRAIDLYSANAVIEDNQVMVSSNSYVRAISCESGSVSVKKNRLEAESASFAGTGVYLIQCTNTIIERNVITAANSAVGETIYVRQGSNVVIRNNVVYGGSGSGTQKGVVMIGASPVIANNTFVMTPGTGPTWALMPWAQSYGPSTPIIVNNIFVSRVASSYAVYEVDAGADPASMHNNLFVGLPTVLYSDNDTASSFANVTQLETGLCAANIPAAGNVSTALAASAVFVDPDSDDWHLATADASITQGGKDSGLDICGGSGCAVAGSASCGAVLDDFDGVMRSPPYSIGAFEKP